MGYRGVNVAMIPTGYLFQRLCNCMHMLLDLDSDLVVAPCNSRRTVRWSKTPISTPLGRDTPKAVRRDRKAQLGDEVSIRDCLPKMASSPSRRDLDSTTNDHEFDDLIITTAYCVNGASG